MGLFFSFSLKTGPMARSDELSSAVAVFVVLFGIVFVFACLDAVFFSELSSVVLFRLFGSIVLIVVLVHFFHLST